MAQKFLSSITFIGGRAQAVTFQPISSGDLPSTVAYTDVANTFTIGPQTVRPGADANIGLLVRANSATQSGHLFQIQSSASAVLSTFDASGRLCVGGNDFSEIVATGGTPVFGVVSGVSRIGYQPNFGAFLSVTGNGVTGYVANPTSGTEGLVVGTFSNHAFSIRTNNTVRVRVDNAGKLSVASYDFGVPTHQMMAVLSTATTNAVNDIFCIRFDGAAGAASDGIGAGQVYQVNTSTTFGVTAVQTAGVWNNKTHASRTSDFRILTVTNAGALAEAARFDGGGGATPSAGNTGMMLWDVDNNTLERVTVGVADSGGAGFKVLRIPN